MNGRPSDRRSADRLIRRVARTEPDVVALAEVVALAVQVDPPLLRAARREFIGHRGPDLEADLWHSALVASSNQSGVVFDELVAERLRFRLASRQDRCLRARAVVVAAHGGVDDATGWTSDTQRLEEELRFLALVPGGVRRARALLAAVRAEIDQAGPDDYRDWHEGLLRRLPPVLQAAAAGRGGPGSSSPDVPVDTIGPAVGLQLLDGGLEVRATAQGSMHRLRLPDGLAPALFVDDRLVPLESLPRLEAVDDPHAVTIETVEGARVVLRRGRRQALPEQPTSVRGNGSETWGCAFSPDGALLAVTGSDEVARIWDAGTGDVLHVLPARGAAVRACAFSPSGAVIATAGADGTVQLWSVTDGRPIRRLEGHDGPVDSCAFSPDGRWLATAGADGTTRLWDADAVSKEPEEREEEEEEAEVPRPVRVLAGHTGAVWSCAFSPDGALLATTGADRSVLVWRPGTGVQLHRLAGHADWVFGAAFSPDGALLATASRDRTVRLWDPVGGLALRTLSSHSNSVWACAFSPDGALLATTSFDHMVRLWDPTNGALLHTFKGHPSRVRGCAFAPDGSRLATAGAGGTVRLWDPTPYRPRQHLHGHESWVYSCSYAPDGARLATAGADRTVRLWDPPTGSLLRTLKGHEDSVESCAFAPDGKTVASAAADGTVRVWSVTGGPRPLRTLRHSLATEKEPAGHVHACAFAPDGRTVASAGADGTAQLWGAGGPDDVLVLRGHRGPVHDVAFAPDGRTVATAGADMTVRLWDRATGALRRTLSGHIREVLSCTFSPDGRWLASTGNDQTVRIWDPVAGRTVRTLRGHTSRIYSCTFSPDGTRVATVGADSTIRLWDPESGEPVDVLTGTHSLLDAAFSPDGTQLTAVGADPVVPVWDLLSREVAVKGDTMGLWLGGSPVDSAAVAGAVAARPFSAAFTPVVAAGGGAIVGVLLAAGIDPRRVERLVVGATLAPLPPGGWWAPWRDPVRRLRRHLRRAGASVTGDLRVPVRNRLMSHRFQAVVVDVATDEIVVLPRDASRIGLAPDGLPLAELAVVAAGLRPRVTIAGRDLAPATDRRFDPGPWWTDTRVARRVLAVDVEDPDGAVPPRRFPTEIDVSAAPIPWSRRPTGVLPSRRQREVAARIGAQSFRLSLPTTPQPKSGGSSNW